MDGLPNPEARYLEGGHDPVFVTRHRPMPEAARDTAVIICPPFGWEEVSSYRMLRLWGAQLAQAGYPTVRVSFPSSGDSGGGPQDPGRLAAWVTATGSAARWLRAETSADRMVAVGMGLGGLVAYLTAAAGPVDDLVLWGTPARGRALLRQLRAFSKLESARFFEGLAPPPPLPSGELEAGGFLLSAETVERLEQVDLTAVGFPAPTPTPRRALLLERDGIAVDRPLREHLEQGGTTVTVAPGPGYGAMTSHPQHARAPEATIERVNAWLHQASSPRSAGAGADTAPEAMSGAEIRLPDGRTLRETPVRIQQPFGALAGVLAEPTAPPRPGPCVVLLNAGAVRRIGPSRMWVQAARRWAAEGVPSLRLDVEGIGDADGDESPYGDDDALYVPTMVPQVISALDFLQGRGVADQFVLGGLCAGAYWAFHAALVDSRVCSAMLLNPRALIWEAGLGPARDMRALLSGPFSLSRIRRAATGPRTRAFWRWLVRTPVRLLKSWAGRESPTAATEGDIDTALEALHRSGKRVLLLFSEHEPLYDELVRSGRMERLSGWPNVTLERIAVRDHTMRPVWSQQQVQAALDRALAHELTSLARAPSAG